MWSKEGTEQARNLRDKDANRVTLCHAVTAGRISSSLITIHRVARSEEVNRVNEPRRER